MSIHLASYSKGQFSASVCLSLHSLHQAVDSFCVVPVAFVPFLHRSFRSSLWDNRWSRRDTPPGVYICKSIVNYLRHGNFICKSERISLYFTSKDARLSDTRRLSISYCCWSSCTCLSASSSLRWTSALLSSFWFKIRVKLWQFRVKLWQFRVKLWQFRVKVWITW